MIKQAKGEKMHGGAEVGKYGSLSMRLITSIPPSVHTSIPLVSSRITNHALRIVSTLGLIACLSLGGWTQCAMCKASVEGGKNPKVASGINQGILLLVAMPYLVAGLVGFAFYRMRTSPQRNELNGNDPGNERRMDWWNGPPSALGN